MELGLETPSRIMRRIEALEAQNGELPSLPSFPAFESESFRESIGLSRFISYNKPK